MGLARNLVKGLKQRVDKVGERIVSSIADTSSDAPTRFSAPKRDVYDKLVADGAIEQKTTGDR